VFPFSSLPTLNSRLYPAGAHGAARRPGKPSFQASKEPKEGWEGRGLNMELYLECSD
jgi:hypothetical protein